jgi:hypothetical protein
MGGSISTWTPADPDEPLFENQIKDIAGDKYDSKIFSELSDGGSYVKASALKAYVDKKIISLQKQEAIAKMEQKSDQVENIVQRNVASTVHEVVEKLDSYTKLLRKSRINGVNPISMLELQDDIRKLKKMYIQSIGVKYFSTTQDFGVDFIAEYFCVLDNPNRTVEHFSSFYTEDSSLKINGVEEFRGREDVIDALMVTI